MKVHALREWTFRLLMALLLAALLLVASLPAATAEVRAQQEEYGGCVTDTECFEDDWLGTNGFAWSD